MCSWKPLQIREAKGQVENLLTVQEVHMAKESRPNPLLTAAPFCEHQLQTDNLVMGRATLSSHYGENENPYITTSAIGATV